MVRWIPFICLVLSTMASCSGRSTKNLWLYLGEFSSRSAQKQTFVVDVKNFERNHWRASLVWDSALTGNYFDVEIVIVVGNYSNTSISTRQTTSISPPDYLQIDIASQETKVIYKGSVAAFLGLDRTRPPANLEIWLQDSERLICQLEVEITPVARLSKAIIFGLSRGEPTLL